jgi:hypothetical protein
MTTESNGNGRIPGDVGAYAMEARMAANVRSESDVEEEVWAHVLKYVENEGLGSITSRSELYRGWRGDPLRIIREECGYPDTLVLEPWIYRAMYDREPIATLVCQLMPRESWQVSPDVYEDEDPEIETPFEKRWKEVDRLLHGQSWYRDMKGSQIWEHLRRADELSGIGAFGVLLLGFNDGKRLDEPVSGALGEGTQFDAAGSPLSRVGIFSGDKSDDNREGAAGAGVDARKIGNLVEPNELTQGGLPEYRYDSQLLGTDAQYVGVQLSHDVIPPKEPGQQLDLLFLRAYDESLVQIVQYEADLRNPRFGLPVMYRITLNDPRELHSGIGLPLATVRVHWSRVIHLADNLGSSEIFGVPRQRPVFNRLIDLAKVYGASAQGYWSGAFMGLSFETHPQLGGDVKIDVASMRQQARDYLKRLQRMITSVGMTAKPLAPQVSDPTAQIKALLECIAMQLRVPMRVFMGSERGELASSQDMQAHNGRVSFRNNMYLTPRVIIPFVDRLISVGVLPEPNKRLSVNSRRQRRMVQNQRRSGWWTRYIDWLTRSNCPAYDVYQRPVQIVVNAKAEKDEDKYATVISEFCGGLVENGARHYPQPQDHHYRLVDNSADVGDMGNSGQSIAVDEEDPRTSGPVDPDDELGEDAPQMGGYVVEWPDLEALTDADKAAIAQQLTAALAQYAQSGAENVMPPALFFSQIMRLDEETTNTIIESAMELLEDPDQHLTPNPLDDATRQQEQHEQDLESQQQTMEQGAESHDQDLQQGQEAHEKVMSEPPPDQGDEEPSGKPPTGNAQNRGSFLETLNSVIAHAKRVTRDRNRTYRPLQVNADRARSDEFMGEYAQDSESPEGGTRPSTAKLDAEAGDALDQLYDDPPAGPLSGGSSAKYQTPT